MQFNMLTRVVVSVVHHAAVRDKDGDGEVSEETGGPEAKCGPPAEAGAVADARGSVSGYITLGEGYNFIVDQLSDMVGFPCEQGTANLFVEYQNEDEQWVRLEHGDLRPTASLLAAQLESNRAAGAAGKDNAGEQRDTGTATKTVTVTVIRRTARAGHGQMF
jgi:hypothetical protein